MTDSGKLYVARKPDKGERKLEEVWVDKKRPIHGAITDTASGKTFLFGAELADSPQFFYFELSDKPEICKCDRPKLIDKRLPRSLDVSISYARILVADKKIKVESKAQPKPDPKP